MRHWRPRDSHSRKSRSHTSKELARNRRQRVGRGLKRRRAELLSGERRRKIPVFIEKRGMEKEEKKELFCFMHKAAKACFYKFMQKRKEV